MTPQPPCFRTLRLALLLALVPCAPAAAGEDENQALRERVAAFWDARVSRSESVYDFYPPPELGGPLDRDRIGELGNVFFQGWRIEGIERDGDTAKVRLRLEATVQQINPGGAKPGEYTMPAREEWNRICGIWWRKPVPRGLARREFAPHELGRVDENGPDCERFASEAKAASAGAPASEGGSQ